jgi:hypothetical protein
MITRYEKYDIKYDWWDITTMGLLIFVAVLVIIILVRL